MPLTVACLTVGCAQELATADRTPTAPPAQNAGGPLAAAGYDGRYRAWFIVLENESHGPQLCQSVGDSSPVTCTGPDVRGWDWTGLDPYVDGGTTTGEYVVTGTWDGERLTLTEPPLIAGPDDRPPLEDPFPRDPRTPCPVPVGGWPAEPWADAADPVLAADEMLSDAEQAARAVRGFGGTWLDRQPDVAVYNVSTTGDADAMTDAVSSVYRGPLCVSRAAATEESLRQIISELEPDPNVVYAVPDVLTGSVQAVVMAATEEVHGDMDARFGSGRVVLTGLLEPID